MIPRTLKRIGPTMQFKHGRSCVKFKVSKHLNCNISGITSAYKANKALTCDKIHIPRQNSDS